MGDCAEKPKPVVLVTGFGPFGNHTVNASWVAVQEMVAMGLGDDSVALVTQEVPVEYDTVRKLVPYLWQLYTPKLVVHVGVSGIAKELTLEQQAHNEGYDKEDVRGACPPDHVCVAGACVSDLASSLNMASVCDILNSSAENDVTAAVSLDPGRYHCDYIYYTSLSIDRRRTAFVHVPPLDKPYSARQLGHALCLAVRAMLAQLG